MGVKELTTELTGAGLFDIPQASAYTGLKPSTMRAKVLKHEIPYYKFSRRVFIAKADLDAWIASGLRPAKTQADVRRGR